MSTDKGADYSNPDKQSLQQDFIYPFIPMNFLLNPTILVVYTDKS